MHIQNNLAGSGLNSNALPVAAKDTVLSSNPIKRKINSLISNKSLLIGGGAGVMTVGGAALLAGLITVNPVAAIVGSVVMLAGAIFTISIILYNKFPPVPNKQLSQTPAINPYNSRPVELADEVGKLCDIGYMEFDHKIHVLLARIADSYGKKEINIHQAKRMIDQLYKDKIVGSRLQSNKRLTNCVKPIEKEFMHLELDAALQMNNIYFGGIGKKEELVHIFEEVIHKYEEFALKTEDTNLQEKYEQICEEYRNLAPERFEYDLDDSEYEDSFSEEGDFLAEDSNIESSDGISFVDDVLPLLETELKYVSEWIDYYKNGIIEFEELKENVIDFVERYESKLLDVPLSIGKRWMQFLKAYQEIEKSLSQGEEDEWLTEELKDGLEEMFQCVELYRSESGYKEEVLYELHEFIEQREQLIQESGDTELKDKFQLLKEVYLSILCDSAVKEEPETTLETTLKIALETTFEEESEIIPAPIEEPKTLNQELMEYARKRKANNMQLGDQVINDIEAKINNSPAYLPQTEPIAYQLSPAQARVIDESPKQQAICLLSRLINTLKRCSQTIERLESDIRGAALAEDNQSKDEIDLNENEWKRAQFEEAKYKLDLARHELCEKLDYPINTSNAELIRLSEEFKQEIKEGRADLSRFEKIEDDYFPWSVEDIPEEISSPLNV